MGLHVGLEAHVVKVRRHVDQKTVVVACLLGERGQDRVDEKTEAGIDARSRVGRIEASEDSLEPEPDRVHDTGSGRGFGPETGFPGNVSRVGDDVADAWGEKVAEHQGSAQKAGVVVDGPHADAREVGAVEVLGDFVDVAQHRVHMVPVLHLELVGPVHDKHLDGGQEVVLALGSLRVLEDHGEADGQRHEDVGAVEGGVQLDAFAGELEADAEEVVGVAVEHGAEVGRLQVGRPAVGVESRLEPPPVLSSRGARHANESLHHLVRGVARGQQDQHLGPREASVARLGLGPRRLASSSGAVVVFEHVVVLQHTVSCLEHMVEHMRRVELAVDGVVVGSAGVEHVAVREDVVGQLLLERRERRRVARGKGVGDPFLDGRAERSRARRLTSGGFLARAGVRGHGVRAHLGLVRHGPPRGKKRRFGRHRLVVHAKMHFERVAVFVCVVFNFVVFLFFFFFVVVVVVLLQIDASHIVFFVPAGGLFLVALLRVLRSEKRQQRIVRLPSLELLLLWRRFFCLRLQRLGRFFNWRIHIAPSRSGDGAQSSAATVGPLGPAFGAVFRLGRPFVRSGSFHAQEKR
ncbi:hypothetical protein CLUG_00460 [Clavispora lusitaniae ATCC 42720]|uniref:Uncharacterized protein n=1 Tax=Clavispora lusitaniae (strain ATCC 42720) TaxID=306902 RepID=C4XWY7_CLAL4|nr:uncharacterized protein CLUG_00460 [Clavispora lusitaniae ATCC 42720]EEQ36338.1 hypothetical protein CLUG_00460 [Clavispora lusitaniae ATCC 42720]